MSLAASRRGSTLDGAVRGKVPAASARSTIRRAVLERYERSGHAARVQESSARLIDEWGDVLHRLGTV